MMDDSPPSTAPGLPKESPRTSAAVLLQAARPPRAFSGPSRAPSALAAVQLASGRAVPSPSPSPGEQQRRKGSAASTLSSYGDGSSSDSSPEQSARSASTRRSGAAYSAVSAASASAPRPFDKQRRPFNGCPASPSPHRSVRGLQRRGSDSGLNGIERSRSPTSPHAHDYQRGADTRRRSGDDEPLSRPGSNESSPRQAPPSRALEVGQLSPSNSKSGLMSFFRSEAKRKTSDKIDLDDLLGSPTSQQPRRRGKWQRACIYGCCFVAAALWFHLVMMMMYHQSTPDMGKLDKIKQRSSEGPGGGVAQSNEGPGRVTAAARHVQHLGALPQVPDVLLHRGWESVQDGSYCKHTEPRFNAECREQITWGERRDSMQRVLNATALWFARQRIDYAAIFSTLLAAFKQDQKLVISHPCMVAITRPDYERVKMLLTTPHLKADPVSKQKSVRYGFDVLEDQPWDKRSETFPVFEGEWWAPLDDAAGVADTGLLYKPHEACSPMRFVDSKTGFYCEAIVMDTDAEVGVGDWFVKWPGGPKMCPPFIQHQHQTEQALPCESDGCYKLHSKHMSPHKPCHELLGVTLRCPLDVEDSLRGCYAYASQVRVPREAAKPAGADAVAASKITPQNVH